MATVLQTQLKARPAFRTS